MDGSVREQNVLGHLMDVEREASSLALDAQAEADRRRNEAKQQADADFRARHEDLIRGLDAWYDAEKKKTDAALESEYRELNLSDSFMKSAFTEQAALECRALMLNINLGHNQELLESCKVLWEYSYFINEVRENQKQGLAIETAVREAQKSCIEKDILKEYTDLIMVLFFGIWIKIFQFLSRKDIRYYSDTAENYHMQVCSIK